jgi:hypothetical protein
MTHEWFDIFKGLKEKTANQNSALKIKKKKDILSKS